MRNYVTFQFPAEFVPVSDEDGILAGNGARWFVSLLQRVPDLEIEDKPCQEDWGVVLFGQRAQKKYWIGVSHWEDRTWLVHFHHASFFSLQRFTSSGRNELLSLMSDFHDVLINEPVVTNIIWYEKHELDKARPVGFPTPR